MSFSQAIQQQSKIIVMPLPGFEQETAVLTDHEKDKLLPVLIEELSQKVGKQAAIKSYAIVGSMYLRGFAITDVTVRKLIAHITNNGLIKCLVSGSNGYWITNDPAELERYERSLLGRENAIKARRLHIALQRRELLKTTQETIIIRHEQ